MQPPEVMRRSYEILRGVGIEPDYLTVTNFLDLSEIVKEVVLHEWPRKKRETTSWLRPFAEGLRACRDEFASIVELDPLVVYKPAHDVALAFHKSTAFIRYFRSGNRCSKSEAGRYEHYAITTGQMIYRKVVRPPVATFIIGTNYTKYAPAVFERKFILGEPGNPLSPAFPKGGKWLHHYDAKKHIVYVSCPNCVAASKRDACTHLSSTQLFSDEGDPMDIAGGQYVLGQFDEHIRREFFDESVKRLESVPYSSLAITHTPLEGKGAWEHQDLTLKYEDWQQTGNPDNYVGDEDE